MSKSVTRYFSRSAFLLFATGVLVSSGCSSSKPPMPAAVVVSEGYTRALKQYNKNDFQEAALVLESLLFTSRATALEDDVLYLLAQTYFHSGQYLLAAEMYARLQQQMPTSPYARASQFMIAKSYEKLSPPVGLDQQPTRKAIENFALYMDLYPMADSSKIASDVETYRELLKINPKNDLYKQRLETATANFSRVDSLRYSEKAISSLREKLAKHVLMVAHEYVKLGKLKAAGIFFDELIERYSDTSYLKQGIEGKIDVLVKRKKWFDASQTLEQYLKRYPEKMREMQGIKKNIAQNLKI